MRNRGRYNRFVFAAAGVLTIVALSVGQSMLDDAVVAEAQGKQAPMLGTRWRSVKVHVLEVDEVGTIVQLGRNGEVSSILWLPQGNRCHQ